MLSFFYFPNAPIVDVKSEDWNMSMVGKSMTA